MGWIAGLYGRLLRKTLGPYPVQIELSVHQAQYLLTGNFEQEHESVAIHLPTWRSMKRLRNIRLSFTEAGGMRSNSQDTGLAHVDHCEIRRTTTIRLVHAPPRSSHTFGCRLASRWLLGYEGAKESEGRGNTAQIKRNQHIRRIERSASTLGVIEVYRCSVACS